MSFIKCDRRSIDRGKGNHVPVIGIGHAIGHHGEVLQGVFFDEAGRLHRGLVSLPCSQLFSMANFEPTMGIPVRVVPEVKTKAAKAARLTLDYLGWGTLGGTLTLSGNIPTGFGLGSSTSDVVAAIRAAAQAVGVDLDTRVVARLAVQAEVASDSIMFGEQALLFAQREAVILEDLGSQLPPLEVLSVNTAPNTPVDTVDFAPARYNSWEIESFRPLRGMLRKAVRTRDAALVGRVATASARINQRFLPKPHFTEFLTIAETCGAVGVQVAHSGTVVGLLFDPGMPDVDRRTANATQALFDLGLPVTFHFRTGKGDFYDLAV